MRAVWLMAGPTSTDEHPHEMRRDTRGGGGEKAGVGVTGHGSTSEAGSSRRDPLESPEGAWPS